MKRAGDLGGAVREYRQLLALPDDPSLDRAAAWFHLGNALLALGRAGEAERAFESALGLQPALMPARFNLGNLLRASRTRRGSARSCCSRSSTATRTRPSKRPTRATWAAWPGCAKACERACCRRPCAMPRDSRAGSNANS